MYKRCFPKAIPKLYDAKCLTEVNTTSISEALLLTAGRKKSDIWCGRDKQPILCPSKGPGSCRICGTGAQGPDPQNKRALCGTLCCSSMYRGGASRACRRLKSEQLKVNLPASKVTALNQVLHPYCNCLLHFCGLLAGDAHPCVR